MNNLHLRFLALLVSLIPAVAVAQDVDSLKSGVVRIQNTYTEEVGTGFIIQVDTERAYVMTASHVVKGNQHPNIYLYNRPTEAVEGTLTYREDDDQKGLALLEFKAKREILAGILPVKLRASADLKGGEQVQVIGFPNATTFWTIFVGIISGLQGRNLVFTGPIRAGNSGSPLFYNGQVVGLVTDIDPNSVYAVRAEGIVEYLGGVNKKLAESVRPQPATEKSTNDKSDFCQALMRIVNSSHDGFYDIVKQGYQSTVVIPGFRFGSVTPETQTVSYSNFTSDSSKALGQYYELVANSKRCLSDWKQIDSNKLGRNRLKKIDAPMRFLFMRRDATTVVIEHSTLDTSYTVELEVYAKYHRRMLGGSEDTDLALAFTETEAEREDVCQDLKSLVAASREGFSSVVGNPGFGGGYFEASITILGFPSINVRRGQEAFLIFNAEELGDTEALNYRMVGILRKCFPSWTAAQVEPRSTYDQNKRRFRLIENTQPGAVFELSYDSRYDSPHRLDFYLYSPESNRKLR